LTHLNEDMLHHLEKVTHPVAEDGMIIELE
jgi:hypothetical protein